MTAFKLEFYKARGRGLPLIVGALAAVELLWMIWSFKNPDASDICWGWMLVLYNLPLLRGIIFPTIAGVLASKQADLEHKSGELRLLETVQSAQSLYTAKFLSGSVYVLAVTVLEIIIMLLMGRAVGFQGGPDMWAYGLTFAFNLVTGLETYAISLALSMSIKNQAVPLCIACGGSFLGLLLMFLPKLTLIRALVPWGHVGALMFVGMDWNKVEKLKGMYYMDIWWPALGVTLLFLAAAFFIGRSAFAKKEV